MQRKPRMTRLVLCAAFLAVAGHANAQSGNQPFSSPLRLMEQDGEAIYHNVCQGCHMPDARGASGAAAYPALANDAKLEQAGYPGALVLNGLGAMPPLGGLLTDAQVAAVVNYVRTHFGNAYTDALTAVDVKAMRN